MLRFLYGEIVSFAFLLILKHHFFYPDAIIGHNETFDLFGFATSIRKSKFIRTSLILRSNGVLGVVHSC